MRRLPEPLSVTVIHEDGQHCPGFLTHVGASGGLFCRWTRDVGMTHLGRVPADRVLLVSDPPGGSGQGAITPAP